MRTLMMGMLFCLVSGVDNLALNVEGSVGDDVLLPCNCPNRDSNKEFRWQAEGNIIEPVVKHTGDTSDFYDEYKDRAKLFLSEDSSNCSLLLKNITLGDKREYKCSFKFQEGPHNYSYVNLNVSKTDAGITREFIGTPTEPTSQGNIQTLGRVMPVAVVLALVAVLSLFVFLFYKRKVPGRLNAGEEERALRISV